MGRIVILAAAVFVLAAVPAASQQVQSVDEVDFSRLVGKPLRIVDARGVERQGRLREAVDRELRLHVPAGEVVVPFDDVRRLDRRDSVGEGLLIGILWPPIAYVLGAGQGFDSKRQAQAALPIQMVVCGAIGAGIDALNKGWTNLYRTPPRGRARLAVVPARGGVGLAYVRSF